MPLSSGSRGCQGGSLRKASVALGPSPYPLPLRLSCSRFCVITCKAHTDVQECEGRTGRRPPEPVADRHAAPSPLACFPLLSTWDDPAIAFFLALAGVHLLALWRLLLRALPGGRSPMQSFLSVPCAAVPGAIILPWGVVGRPIFAESISCHDKRHKWKPRPARIPFWFRALLWLGAFPVQVWAVPPELAAALTEAHHALTPDPGGPEVPVTDRPSTWHDIAADLQPASRQEAQEPDDFPPPHSEASGSSQGNTGQGYRARVEADIASGGASSCLQAQPGLCVATPGIRVPARVTLCAPGYPLTTTD